MALFNDHIAVMRAPLVHDSYGEHRDWSNATEVWAGIGALLPYRRALWDSPAVRDTTKMRGTIYFPGLIPLDSNDRFMVNGETFQGAGPPWNWKMGSRTYTEMFVVRVTK